MAQLDMYGPYELKNKRIDSCVTKKSAGNYALGYIRSNRDNTKSFIVKYVGRSDDDVNDRLKDHVGEKDDYEYFMYSYASSPKAAFEKECLDYHNFGESRLLNNDIHPARPSGCNWKCPCCNS